MSVMTGRISPRQATSGNIGTLVADIPAEPKRNEPFALILLPAALGGMIVAGRRIGYPVVRHERCADQVHAPPLDRRRARAPCAGAAGSAASSVARRRRSRPCTLDGESASRSLDPHARATGRTSTPIRDPAGGASEPASPVPDWAAASAGSRSMRRPRTWSCAFADPHDRDRLANTLR